MLWAVAILCLGEERSGRCTCPVTADCRTVLFRVASPSNESAVRCTYLVAAYSDHDSRARPAPALQA